jgi:hypothetical protein
MLRDGMILTKSGRIPKANNCCRKPKWYLRNVMPQVCGSWGNRLEKQNPDGAAGVLITEKPY